MFGQSTTITDAQKKLVLHSQKGAHTKCWDHSRAYLCAGLKGTERNIISKYHCLSLGQILLSQVTFRAVIPVEILLEILFYRISIPI